MTGTKNPYQSYQNNAVQTASPGELTLMVYNGCLKFLKQAKQGLNEQDLTEKNKNLLRAQDCITELMVTLNTDYPVGVEMMHMYEYLKKRLIEANVRNDVTIIEEVEQFVTEFRDTWKEVIKITRQIRYSDSENQA